jgi:hypothetical protein
MNATDARLLELALKKQRLQFTSEQLRHRFAHNLTFVQPLCAGLDRVRSAWHWLRERPAIPVAVAVALVVGRPRAVWRWARRGFFAWQTWQRARHMMETALKR